MTKFILFITDLNTRQLWILGWGNNPGREWVYR